VFLFLSIIIKSVRDILKFWFVDESASTSRFKAWQKISFRLNVICTFLFWWILTWKTLGRRVWLGECVVLKHKKDKEQERNEYKL